ncbi:MAG: YraN family protein [Bacteroidetes bacterium 4572_112]|nr:MAG: YraN family protein [Bacteroidetes bacterium 4572_112]
MSKASELGKLGEDIASEFLIKKGFKVIERNWRTGRYEIDIIALDNDTLVFVEVKTRSTDYFIEPELALTKKQQRFIIKAANAYINTHSYDTEARFDIISIVMHPQGKEIKHIDEAFYPYME